MAHHVIFSILLWSSIIISLFLCETEKSFDQAKNVIENLSSKDIESTHTRARLELFTYGTNQFTTTKGGVESEEKVNKRRKLSRKRNMIDHFISSSDSAILEKYIESRRDVLSMTYPGNYARGVQDFHYNTTAIIENDLFEVTKLLLYAVFKATDYIELFFNTDLRYDVIAVSRRNIPGLVYHMNLHRVTKTQFWCHEFHSDYCTAGDRLGNGRLSCTKGTEKKDRQYTAALYFNDLEGGEFAFIDVPVAKKTTSVSTRRLLQSHNNSVDVSATSINEKDIDNEEASHEISDSEVHYTVAKKEAREVYTDRRQYLRNLAATSPKIKTAHPRNTLTPKIFEGSYIQKYAAATLYAPKPGRLVMFTSGVENIHAVTEIISRNRSRNMLNFWFTPANYTYNIGDSSFWTGCKRTSTESCHSLANYSY